MAHNFHKVLSGPKAEVKYGSGGIFFLLVEDAQVKKKVCRKVSSYGNNRFIDPSCFPRSLP